MIMKFPLRELTVLILVSVIIFGTTPVLAKQNGELPPKSTTSQIPKHQAVNASAQVNNSSVFSAIGNIKSTTASDEVITEEPETNTKMAVFLVKYNDVTSDPFTANEAKETIFNGNFRNFFAEQSYGQVIFCGDVFGWVAEQESSATCDFYNSATITPGSALDNYVNENQIDLDSYDYIFIVRNCPDYVGFNGLAHPGIETPIAASIGSSWWLTNDWSMYIPGFTGLDRVMIHETGHLLGLNHANGLDCGDETIDTENMINCDTLDAGNQYDAMGNSIYAVGFNAFERNKLGWISTDNVLSIDTSGTYQLKAVENAVGDRMAKISVTAKDGTVIETPYRLEYHIPKGFAKSLSQFGPLGLTLSQISYGSSNILDAQASELDFGEDMKDSTIGRDESFVDPYYGITIDNVKRIENGTMSFHVDLAMPESCDTSEVLVPSFSTFWSAKENNSQKGEVTISTDKIHIVIPKAKVDADRQIVNLQFNATNTNEFLCGASPFTITMTTPSPTLIYKNGVEYPGSFELETLTKAGSNYSNSYQIIVPKGTAVGNYTPVLTSTDEFGEISEPLVYTITIE